MSVQQIKKKTLFAIYDTNTYDERTSSKVYEITNIKMLHLPISFSFPGELVHVSPNRRVKL